MKPCFTHGWVFVFGLTGALLACTEDDNIADGTSGGAGTGASAGTGGTGGTAGSSGTGGTTTGGTGGASGTGGATTGGTSGASGTGGTATGGTAGAAGAAGTGGALACAGGCQPLEECWKGERCITKSVSVPSGFSIDATEVTRSQYEAWLATNPAATGQQSTCDWNTSFAPDSTCMAQTSVCQGAGCDNHPQVCVDWCDAAAYCQAIGRHVCGKIGGGVVTVDNDPNTSQWFHVCTSGGVNDFVYGDAPDEAACHDYMPPTTTTEPVSSMPGCQSSSAGYAGIFDLVGNVWEWENNCFGDGATAICHPRGFSFGPGAAMPMCDGSNYAERSAPADNIGFRCCKDGEVGSACTFDDECNTGLKCCYPCGIPGCENQCTVPDGTGECPAFP